MVDVRVTFQLDRAALRALSSRSGLVGRAVYNAAKQVRQRGKYNVARYGRIRSGDMMRGIDIGPRIQTDERVVETVVSPVDYSIYQHDGTRYISPAPFLTDALESLSANDFRP